MILKYLLFSVISIAFATPVFSQDLGKFYFQKNYWTKFNWDAAEESALWIDSGFAVRYRSTDVDGKTYQSNQKVIIDGKTYNASLIKYTLKIDRADFTEISLLDVLPGDCERTNKKLVKIFNSQSAPINNKYYQPGNGFVFDETAWQWDLGSTRATLFCKTIGYNKNKSDFEHVWIRFEAATDDSKQEPPVYLNCDRSYLSAQDKNTWVTAQPLALTVIPAKKVVANAELVQIGSLDSISGSQIKFSFKNAKGGTVEYSISRIDGTLTGTATERDQSDVMMLKGKCERRDPNAKKF